MRAKNQTRPTTVSFRLPKQLMEKVRRLAKKNRRTLSGEVQLAIEQHLQVNGERHDAVSSKE